jgi:hypothetical protein
LQKEVVGIIPQGKAQGSRKGSKYYIYTLLIDFWLPGRWLELLQGCLPLAGHTDQHQ